MNILDIQLKLKMINRVREYLSELSYFDLADIILTSLNQDELIIIYNKLIKQDEQEK